MIIIDRTNIGTEIFVNDGDDYEYLQEQYDLEECGASGYHVGYDWSCDDKAKVDVYYRECDDHDLYPY